MAFVNFSLLAGMLCVGIPIALHLVMRRKPKQLMFPAVRFVHARREMNRRRLRLRHWLLLALRCLAIILVALALARPSVSSAAIGDWLTAGGFFTLLLISGGVLLGSVLLKKGRLVIGGFAALSAVLAIAAFVSLWGALSAGSAAPIGKQEAPVAAALVVDTAPRMGLLQQNESRLQRAQTIGQWLLRQLPADSDIAVLSSQTSRAIFSVDRAAATRNLETLTPSSRSRSLVKQLEEAVRLVKTSEHERGELYVFSDLTQAAWSDASQRLRKLLEEYPDVSLYVIDVSARDPQNFALGDLNLSSEVITGATPFELAVDTTSTGATGERTVELLLEKPDPTRPVVIDGEVLSPESQLRGRKSISLAPGQSQRLRFSLAGLPPGIHQGTVSIAGKDNLAIDDVRHFTLQVREPWPVLIVTPEGVSGENFVDAIAPYALRESGRAAYQCRTVQQKDLSGESLEDYALVCLIDPEPLSQAAWNGLHQYAEQGGSLFFSLGRHAAGKSGRIDDSFQSEAAAKILPGTIAPLAWRSPNRDLTLAPQSLDHPALAPFRAVSTAVPWLRFPVFHHWVVSPGEDSLVVLPFGNGHPAILQRNIGQGRVMVWTTPISDPPARGNRKPWNELAIGENAWPYFVLANESARYLTTPEASRLNYFAGETASILAPSGGPDLFQLFTPEGLGDEVLAADDRLTVRYTDQPGAYRLRAESGGAVSQGFSVNVPETASDLTPLPEGRLNEMLGEDRYLLARNPEEIRRGVGAARMGREFYPLLVIMLAVVLGCEYLIANRFYREES